MVFLTRLDFRKQRQAFARSTCASSSVPDTKEMLQSVDQSMGSTPLNEKVVARKTDQYGSPTASSIINQWKNFKSLPWEYLYVGKILHTNSGTKLWKVAVLGRPEGDETTGQEGKASAAAWVPSTVLGVQWIHEWSDQPGIMAGLPLERQEGHRKRTITIGASLLL